MHLGFVVYIFFFFQGEDGIRGRVAFRGVGDVFKKQAFRGGV